jgi:undecaprenyl phosphate N,N'-diacetylbacillosamine 1-phosphate transferase
MYTYFFKRLIDLVVAIIGLIILSPIFVLITIMLFVSLKGNPFFVQARPGKGGKIFKIVKFRTMLNTKNDKNELLPDEQRLFGFGKIVRKLSLDEIPQLINVLMGDMSLIGPRPLLVRYLPLYNEEQNRRHLLRPGITGWAQVNGRNNISWQDKFKLDVWYVDNISFLIDIKILFLTVYKVIKKEGISSSEHVTMEEFKGNN